ncbi:MAG: 2-hydroxy-3-oxopropionate reductase [Christensenellales bacterium]|jgi:2-hydroxy-3-oxopropionate reductase
MTKPTIGFIGLGIMGKPMSKNLLKAGYPLKVFDLNRDAVEEVAAAGASAAQSVAEAAKDVDILITMLPNSPQVEQVVLDQDDAVITAVKPGAIVVDMSSIAPLVSKKVGEALAEKGVIFFDAPVSGGEPKAIDGSLSIMIGGPQKHFEKIEPVMLTMGASAVLVGDVGSGNTTKLANQIIVACNIAALSEALILAQEAGVDGQKVFEAIRGGLAGSTVMEAKAPMMLSDNFKPGFRIDLHVKDLNNVVETASAIDAPIDLTNVVLEMMKKLQQDGKGALDHSALYQIYEDRVK